MDTMTHTSNVLTIPMPQASTLQPTQQPTQQPNKEQSRQHGKECLYTALYGTLAASVYDFEPDLLPGDDESIMTLLAGELHSYRGRLTDSAFTAWALKFIKRQAKRYADTGRMLSANNRVIHSAIIRTMPYSILDCSLTSDDLVQEAAIRIFKNAESLADVDNPAHTAKQSTRVFSLTKKHIAYYYSIPLRRDFNATVKSVSQGLHESADVEILSDLEIQEMRGERDLMAA